MSSEIKCWKCKEAKTESEFSVNQTMCKSCSSQYHRDRLAKRTPPQKCLACCEEKVASNYRRSPRVGMQKVCRECEEKVLQCSRCGVVKDHNSFAPDKAISTGRKSWCNTCGLDHQRPIRATIEYKIKARKLAREHAQRPEVRAIRLPAMRAYFATENGKQKIRKYSKSQKGYLARARRRARVAGVAATLTLTEWLEILTAHKNSCAYCKRPFVGKLKPEQDHKIPVNKGGGLTKENIVPACRYCNASKCNREKPVSLPPGV